MPKFEVTLRYRAEYSGTKIISAQDEDAAEAKVQAAIEKLVPGFSAFKSYVKEPQLDDEEVEIESIDET